MQLRTEASNLYHGRSECLTSSANITLLFKKIDGAICEFDRPSKIEGIFVSQQLISDDNDTMLKIWHARESSAVRLRVHCLCIRDHMILLHGDRRLLVQCT